jgi:hypothetical protein
MEVLPHDKKKENLDSYDSHHIGFFYSLSPDFCSSKGDSEPGASYVRHSLAGINAL